ncbi:hypothetical protein [Archaeoglobus sp.]
MSENLAHVAMNTLLWEAAVMLLVIGFVEMGIGKNEPKDFGIVLFSGAIMETIAMVFVILGGDIFGATVAAAFIMLLWFLGIALILGGTNRMAINHAVWFTGVLFLGFTLFAFQIGHMTLAAALGLLVLVTWLLSLANYTGNHTFGKVAGALSFIDAWIFLAMAYANVVGIALP